MGGGEKKIIKILKRYKRKDVSNRKRGNTTATESSALTCLIRGNLECVGESARANEKGGETEQASYCTYGSKTEQDSP